MNRLIVPAILALAIASPAAAETRNVTGFTQVDASAGVDVIVTVGQAFRVDVTGPGADRIITRVSGDVLHVQPTPGINFGPRPRAEIRVSMPTLTGLRSSSGADLKASGITGGDISLETSSGADIEVSGTCVGVRAEASSGSDIDASNLRCTGGSVDVSSGADVTLHVTGVLNVEASSGGGVNVAGDPRMGDISLSSGGSVNRTR